jgi:hypothetical protein
MPVFTTILGKTAWTLKQSTIDGAVGFSTTSVIRIGEPAFQTLGTTGGFTVEWFQFFSTATFANNFPVALFTSAGSPLFSARYQSATSLRFNVVGAGAGNVTIPNYTNKWTHQAWCRSSTTLRYFLNGSSIYSVTPNLTNATAVLCIGNCNIPGAGFNFPGAITNVRWTSSVALYNANFFPPSTPLTEFTGSTLLLLKNYSRETVLSTNTAFLPSSITSTPTLTWSNIRQPLPFIPS